MSRRAYRATNHGEPDAPGMRRWRLAGTIGGAALLLAAGLGVAAADTGGATAQVIRCPVVADRLPAVPAAAEAEVLRNLAQLNEQVAEANRRLASSRGQGGPNFVNNAILGPLADKRRAAIERISIAIGRHGPRPTGLEALAPCQLAPAGSAVPTEPSSLRAVTS
ncbi:MAG TPA: hypothetical protein VIL44_03790 [Micromonospora sp.]